MRTSVASRGTRDDHSARLGRQAPLSGRQGALPINVRGNRKSRPGDTIAVARKLAKDTA